MPCNDRGTVPPFTWLPTALKALSLRFGVQLCIAREIVSVRAHPETGHKFCFKKFVNK